MVLRTLLWAVLVLQTQGFNDTFYQPPKTRLLDEQWTEWGEWSQCSRTCNGGVSYRERLCRGGSCKGPQTKYRICNMQACEHGADFRAQQCAAFNDVPYRGALYDWAPFWDPEDACALTCMARRYRFVVKLAAAVHDGSRCRPGSLDMCVAGECKAVGCDLQLGSNKKIDQCGVCGGDGSSCLQLSFRWDSSKLSPCSVSCGGGFRISRPLCRNRITGAEVDEHLCMQTTKPQPHIATCSTERCPPAWVEGQWGPCSASCDGGRQTRRVQCMQRVDNGTRVALSSRSCPRRRPLESRPCSERPCPRWLVGPWSACSSTCGPGFQVRTVSCGHGAQCEAEARPPSRQQCEAPCPPADNGARPSDMEECAGPPCPEPSPLQPAEGVLSSPTAVYTWRSAGYSPCSSTCGGGRQEAVVQCVRLDDHATVDESLCDEGSRPAAGLPRLCNAHPCIPHWQVGAFSACSKSCGGGVRARTVSCGSSSLPGPLCPSPRPAATVPCGAVDCPAAWEIQPWSKCSQSCGGGVQTRKLRCLQVTAAGVMAELPPASCGTRPPSSRPCGNPMCPTTPPPPPLFEQESATVRRLTLPARGRARVYPGTLLKLRCPHGGLNVSDVRWYKEWQRVVETPKKFSFSLRGSLRIKNVGPEDEGIYTCVAGSHKSGISIALIDSTSTSPLPQSSQPMPEYTSEVPTTRPPLPRLQHLLSSFRPATASPTSSLGVGWRIKGAWSECSVTCGGSGVQVRSVVCELRVANATRTLGSQVCRDAGMVAPASVLPCAHQPCPVWREGPWSECEECFSLGRAYSRREVTCGLPDGRTVPRSQCDVRSRPPPRQPCANPGCRPAWHHGPWAECTAACDQQGIRTRVLKCVWSGTMRRAGNACRDLPRPSVAVPCQGPPCRAGGKNKECVDKSRYCKSPGNTEMMCRLAWFRDQCCDLCRQPRHV